jgi:uncharacterized protein (DUF2147 family)
MSPRTRPYAFLLLISFGSLAHAATGVLGDWINPTQSVIRIYPCGNSVCAKIVKLSPTAPGKVDHNNPNASLRNRPLCGLEIGIDFHRIDADHLDGGHLYDPESGRTYKGTITSAGDELNLRGYIGIPLLGRTEVWHRVPSVAACQ